MLTRQIQRTAKSAAADLQRYVSKMNTYIFAAILIVYSQLTIADNITDTWVNMIKQCESALIEGELEKARILALKLNEIDPADTHVMYYIVLTSVELGLPIPKWLLEEPWPNATVDDRENYKRAMAAINGT